MGGFRIPGRFTTWDGTQRNALDLVEPMRLCGVMAPANRRRAVWHRTLCHRSLT